MTRVSDDFQFGVGDKFGQKFVALQRILPIMFTTHYQRWLLDLTHDVLLIFAALHRAGLSYVDVRAQRLGHIGDKGHDVIFR